MGPIYLATAVYKTSIRSEDRGPKMLGTTSRAVDAWPLPSVSPALSIDGTEPPWFDSRRWSPQARQAARTGARHTCTGLTLNMELTMSQADSAYTTSRSILPAGLALRRRQFVTGGAAAALAAAVTASRAASVAVPETADPILAAIEGHWAYLFRGANHPEGNPMNILSVDRALSIYGALADRSETKGAHEQLSKHPMKMYAESEKDEHRLTVHGLSYLRKL
jgi:hypothetical protein